MTVEADALSPKQALLMWCLLGSHGETSQSTISPKVAKADRETLVRKGFIRSEKRARGLFLSVEDKGWRWAGDHLDATLPANFKALENWLALIARHLETSDRTLAEFVGPKPGEQARRIARAPSNKKTRLTPAKLRSLIDAAYLVVTGGRKAEKAMLSDLRRQLSTIDRTTLDAGLLRILQGDAKARLGQMNSPKELSEEERHAAFNPAGEPFHFLWIQS